ncbi:hypothetical protein PPYR_14047 [Photinus pyralis]|uniref:Uncharacterized protein n=2 Tax=Photinus pyralis TaxID=7054 RepID=A0A5N4A445_PHOPY|nr:uncharacterized protein LOC116181513 [Photinus pyralis]XP_031357755.1 uncharacterized protein LOC116181513 [Photinus pyralis]XP_031357756.1 uncharacterized protein LOC116181513 [Photinus pyralis]KAB0792086.1 hypothetical protein PPYR_14047 [Photinus pyralis]
MFAITIDEDVQLDAMQRAWQSKRVPSLFEEPADYQDLFSPLNQNKSRCSSPAPPLSCCDATVEHDVAQDTVQEVLYEEPHEKSQTLDASVLGDLPASYSIHGLKPHQQPVVGVYIDRRVCPGFKYKVQPLPGSKEDDGLPYLFDGKALTLKSIGRGYARRFTFESDKGRFNNENYFWSDNRPEGFGFELELVSDGDKFTVFDANHEAQGTLEILRIKGAQIELSSEVVPEGIKKKAKINFTGKVEFYETGVAKPMPMFGVATCVKAKDKSSAQLIKISNVTIKHHRYYLTPGVNTIHRRVTVRGDEIGDINTKYTMTGLEHYEIPVVGTYVDPRVVPGFCYRVRPNDRKDHLFDGRALRLCSIGMGYAKRLTFAPDSLVSPDNYLWSDSHPDGLGLEPRAVHTGMKFSIMAGDQQLGEASVFRADAPQQEERMERVPTHSGKCAIIKYIHINVTCHVKLANTGGRSPERDEYLMRVYGLAVVRKDPNTSIAYVERVENVGLDSQLNILFACTHTELVFYPLH